MKLKYEFAIREVAGSIVAMPVGSDSFDFNGMIKLNSVGKFIFEQLKVDTDIEKILKNIKDSYDVTDEDAKKSVEEFIDELRKADLLAE